jgi:hypothetical protein
MAQAKLTVSKEQAKKIGLLTIHTDSKYPIIYDPKSGVNLQETGDGEFIEVPDRANLVNLARMQGQGFFDVAEGVIDELFDARLDDVAPLTFSAGTLDPAFNSDVYEYTLTLPNGTTEPPTITNATNNVVGQTVTINDAATLEEDATVVVVSANGEVTKTYSIGFVVETV